MLHRKFYLLTPPYRVESSRQSGIAFSYLQTVFGTGDRESKDEEVKSRQNELLTQLIQERGRDGEFMRFLFLVIMRFLFLVIGNLSPARRVRLVVAFLEQNRDIDDFRDLTLTPTVWSSAGSEVPILQEWVDFYEKLLPSVDSVDLLEHRHGIQSTISGLRRAIEEAKKRDFLREY